MSATTEHRTPARYFVSYAHNDMPAAVDLLNRLRVQMRPSARYDHRMWRDLDALVLGERFHTEIATAIDECHAGLLLVSPSFLGSPYITEVELPRIVGLRKPVLPVALEAVRFGRQNLRGLEELQLFRLLSPRRRWLTFAECGARRDDFAAELFEQIERRLDRLNADGGAA